MGGSKVADVSCVASGIGDSLGGLSVGCASGVAAVGNVSTAAAQNQGTDCGPLSATLGR